MPGLPIVQAKENFDIGHLATFLNKKQSPKILRLVNQHRSIYYSAEQSPSNFCFLFWMKGMKAKSLT
jgi:hypothetical protein